MLKRKKIYIKVSLRVNHAITYGGYMACGYGRMERQREWDKTHAAMHYSGWPFLLKQPALSPFPPDQCTPDKPRTLSQSGNNAGWPHL